MFVSRRVLIGTLITLVCVSFLLYATKPYSIIFGNQGQEAIVVEIATEAETVADITNIQDKDPAQTTVEDTETGHVEADTEKEEAGTVDLSASSPQPSTTIEPRGYHSNTNTSSSEHEIPDSWLHVKDTQEILDFVHAQCKKFNKITAEPGEAKKPRMLIVPQNWREHMILYASNPKTGSTSFKKWYARIQGDTRDYANITGVHVMKKYGNIEEAWDFAKEKVPDPNSVTLADMIKPFYKVCFLRNPLTRLISGFRDKVLRRARDGLKGEMIDIDPTLTGDSTDAEKFAAFAEGVIQGTIKNFHFTSQWGKMKICDYPFDLIAQTETTTQQIKEVQEHTNTTQFEFPGSRSEQGYDSVATVHLAHQFYDKVKPEIMNQIYQYYKWDFVLMGYSKLNNPNFPYLDFEQDFEKEYGPFEVEDFDSNYNATEPPAATVNEI